MAANVMDVRDAEEAEIPQLAKIWYDAWHDAHSQIVPAELTRRRTLESFANRLRAVFPNIRVTGPPGDPGGFCITKDLEVYQLFVAAHARRSGIGGALLADAEVRIAERGAETAWLACAIGNDRAAAFYEARGWRRAGTMVNQAETTDVIFPLKVWRYEKIVGRILSSRDDAGNTV